MDRKTHVRFSGGHARATAHGYPTQGTFAYGRLYGWAGVIGFLLQ